MDFLEFKAFVSAAFPGLTEHQLQQFEQLGPLYKEWNERINVISRKDMDGLYLHHVLHSLAIARYMESNPSVKFSSGDVVLDLGCGGGFPGIPLAIMYPDVHFVLCDSVGKKTIVASAVTLALGLGNVEVVNKRAEELGRTFDFVVSRAVTDLENFYPWVRGRFRKSILYLKGGDVAEETGRMMARWHLPAGSVSTWPVDSWLKDGYFAGKYVIDIHS